MQIYLNPICHIRMKKSGVTGATMKTATMMMMMKMPKERMKMKRKEEKTKKRVVMKKKIKEIL